MNRLFLLFFGICLISCGSTKSFSSLSVRENSGELFNTNNLKPESVKPKIEDKAVVLLNQLFNSDEANKKMVLMITNESDCDFTMSILGGKSYTVPVAAKKTESIVVEQGEYVMRSDVCKSPYLTKKILSENTQVNIKYSVVKNTDKSTLSVP